MEKAELFQYELYGQFYLMLGLLIKNFSTHTNLFDKRIYREGNQRLAQIINYVYTNYNRNIRLSEVAERMFVSVSALSRFFYKSTGESFVQYVKKIRIQKVAEGLTNSEYPITRLALENGYSSSSAMNADFKKYYGVTPSEYRQVQKKKAINLQADQKETDKIRTIIKKGKCKSTGEIIKMQSLEADVTDMKQFKRWENRVLNVGSPEIMEKARTQEQILFMKDTLQMDYIRIWRIFSKEMTIYEENSKKANFDRIDALFDFCVKHRLKLFLDLGPRTNVEFSSERNVIYQREDQIEFESEEEWQNFIELFISHLIKRYGLEEVSTWIYEFSFFLNAHPYYISQNYSNRHVWDVGYEIIKQLLPDAAVAGFGLIASDYESMEMLIDSMFSTKYQPDIFTVNHVPYSRKEDGSVKKILDEEFMSKQIDIIQMFLKKYQFQGKYYIVNWNNSIANRNYVQDSCFRGTFILKNVLDNFEKVDQMSFGFMSDLINLYYDTEKILNGSSGILTKNGICKPAYYALEFLSLMGRYKIAQNDYCIITANSENDLFILCYNKKSLNLHYYLMEENRHKPDDLEKLFTDRDKLNLEITLAGFPYNSCYRARHCFVNEQYGSVLDKWIEMGCPEDMLQTDISYLKQIVTPAIKTELYQSEKGVLKFKLHLAPHEMRWISLIKE